MHSDAFSNYHPAVNFCFFAAVIGFSIAFMNPVFLCISLVSSIAFFTYLSGVKTLKKTLLFVFAAIFLGGIINPIFNHNGVTILLYLPSGNPLTVESIVYGLAAAAMLCSVIIWFNCLNKIITSDKIVFLFGRVAPALSLVISMALRFVPRFLAQIKEVSLTQRSMGKYSQEDGLFKKIRASVSVLSIVISWALENGLDTADSMKSRGYGLKNRTSYAIFRWSSRDLSALISIIAMAVFIITASILGAARFKYFPFIKGGESPVLTLITGFVYLLLSALPLILNLWEDRKWKYLA